MINKFSFVKSTCNISRTPVCIYMVGAILCIIFDNKHNTFFPNGAFTQIIYKHSYGKIVISQGGIRARDEVVALQSAGVDAAILGPWVVDAGLLSVLEVLRGDAR